jgi:hypothetical protein
MTYAPLALELRLIRGPLDDAGLKAIADLYGEYSAKYRDPAFCRRLFNQNPAGYSLHAFLAGHSGRLVGHHAVIPMNVSVRGRPRAAGKAEAYVVHADFRKATVIADGRDQIASLALPLHLYRFALEQGMEVVHMLAPPEVGMIHRMAGCRPLPAPHTRARLALGPAPAAADRRGALTAALATAQGVASRLAWTASLAWLGKTRRLSGADLDAALIARIVADLPAAGGWTIAVDAPTLAWLARTGDLEVIALDGKLDDYALVCGRAGEGRVMEVVLWMQRSASERAALRLLGAVVEAARRLDDLQVAVSHTAAPDPAMLDRLRAAERRLFFRERVQDSNVYVRSDLPYYLDPQYLSFTPFFYAVF